MDRPYVVVKVVASVDGRISIGPNLTMWDEIDDRRTRVMGGEAVWKQLEARLNAIHQPQADLLGSNSLIREGEALRELPIYQGDPEPLYQDFLPDEVVHRPGHRGWLVVVDGRGRVRGGYKGEDDWQMLHLVSHRVSPDYLAFLQRERIPYLIAGAECVDLQSVLEKMKRLLNVNSLITSAGGRLGGALLRAGLADEVNVIFKPQIYGGDRTPSLFAAPDLQSGEQPASLKLLSAQVETDGHVWLRYRVEHPGEPD